MKTAAPVARRIAERLDDFYQAVAAVVRWPLPDAAGRAQLRVIFVVVLGLLLYFAGGQGRKGARTDPSVHGELPVGS